MNIDEQAAADAIMKVCPGTRYKHEHFADYATLVKWDKRGVWLKHDKTTPHGNSGRLRHNKWSNFFRYWRAQS